MKTKKVLFLILITIFITISCGKRLAKTYIDDQKKMLKVYNNEQYQKALKLADKFVITVNKKAPQDTYIALLERGKVALDAGSYDVAIKDLQEGEKRFLDIEGTISIKEEASSLFLDDTTKEYEAQPLEKIMISPYLALAYWAKGDFQGARVERNRTIVKINQYIEDIGKDADYLENPFARYLSAIIYENEAKFDDAKIEYRKMKNRTPHLGSFADKELNRLKKRPKLSDLVVFVDLGKSPWKVEKKHKGSSRNSKGTSIIINIVYAYYKARPYQVKKCKILVNGEDSGRTFPLYFLSKTILAEYKKNKKKLIGKLVARAALKTAAQVGGKALMKSKSGAAKAAGAVLSIFGAASAALERADLRSWVTLPAEVHAFRKYGVGPGNYKVQLVYLNASGAEIGRSPVKEVMIPEDKIGVVYFRVLR